MKREDANECRRRICARMVLEHETSREVLGPSSQWGVQFRYLKLMGFSQKWMLMH